MDRYAEMPRLFWFVQLAVAASGHDARFGTAGTAAGFLAPWREEPDTDDAVHALLGRAPTAQDRLLWALGRPARLLEMARHFVLFDGADKKIARHPQYFAVRRTLARVRESS